MKKFKTLTFLVGMMWVATLIALACKQEFAETPQNSTVLCDQNITTVANGLSGTSRTTATVLDNLNKPVNGAAVTVSTFGGSLSDPVTAQALPDQFVTQTNDQGRVQVDLTCPNVPLTCKNEKGARCDITFDIGVDSVACFLEVTAPTTGLPDCPT